MNKSLLIVICDFLILSIISLAKFDEPVKEDKTAIEEAQSQSFADSQLLEMLKTSLEKEKDRREELGRDVIKLAKAAKESANQSEKHRKVLEAREKELKRLAETKNSLVKEREEILKKSHDLQMRVEQGNVRNRDLQSEIAKASDKLEKSANERANLVKEIGNLKTVDSVSRVKLENAQNALKANGEKLARLRAEREKILAEKNIIALEKQALATQLAVATTKTAIYEENLKQTQAMVDIERNEKAQILEHAENLAANVGDLSKDVKAARPKTPSEIFESVKKSFAVVKFDYVKRGLLSSSKSTDELRALPVKIGDKNLLLFSAKDTPICPTFHTYFEPDSLSVSATANGLNFEAREIFCLKEDPRLLAIELTKEFVEKAGITPLEPTENTYAFPNCAVIDSENFRYGQAPFRADFKRSDYARLDVGLISSIFSDFSPSESDYVISQSGEWLGIMANSTVAIIERAPSLDRALPLGKEYTPNEGKSFVGYNSGRLRALPLDIR